ncbi:MAG: methylated-DNA--[protein]-cysteine S-methyltransferase [Methanobacteriota archaeon]|nr:MAG: methylated-DNA--[protein]-cysteine S-methyltransferase [Euryarchaeota archaeon]
MQEVISTPFGRVRVEHDGDRIREIHLGARTSATEAASPIAQDLSRYFHGESADLGRYRVDLTGYTDFQRRVYEETRAIPPGEVRTYGEIARAIGKPGASRAVGNALGRNPACIVIPCHRVVGANGGLGGFTGGLRWKRALLRLEGSPIQ